MQIIRYLDERSAARFLSQHSTFCLQSHLVYQEMEGTETNRGVRDPNEGNHSFADGGTSIQNAYLLSCWSMVCDRDAGPNWSLFENTNQGIAIVSTPSRVARFLKCHVEKFLGNSWILEHCKVRYYNRAESTPRAFEIPNTIFWKPARSISGENFEVQKEYRFAFRGDLSKRGLRSVVFRCFEDDEETNPAVIDRILIGPNVTPTVRRKLLDGVIALNWQRLVENFELEVKK